MPLAALQMKTSGCLTAVEGAEDRGCMQSPCGGGPTPGPLIGPCLVGPAEHPRYVVQRFWSLKDSSALDTTNNLRIPRISRLFSVLQFHTYVAHMDHAYRYLPSSGQCNIRGHLQAGPGRAVSEWRLGSEILVGSGPPDDRDTALGTRYRTGVHSTVHAGVDCSACFFSRNLAGVEGRC